MLAAILMGRAVDRHRLCGENRGGKEQCVVVLAAVKAVADADPVWLAYRRDPAVATQASATYLLHGRPATPNPGLYRIDPLRSLRFHQSFRRSFLPGLLSSVCKIGLICARHRTLPRHPL